MQEVRAGARSERLAAARARRGAPATRVPTGRRALPAAQCGPRRAARVGGPLQDAPSRQYSYNYSYNSTFTTTSVCSSSSAISSATRTAAASAQPAVPDAYSSGRVSIEENMVNDFTKAITAYFGDALIDADDEPPPPSRRRGRVRRPPRDRRKRSPPDADAATRSHEHSLDDGIKSVSPPPTQDS